MSTTRWGTRFEQAGNRIFRPCATHPNLENSVSAVRPRLCFPVLPAPVCWFRREGLRVGWMLMFAEAFFIIFNHVILTPAIKRKLAPEKRRSKLLPSNKGAFHRG
jgi:hypothetical protein